MLGWERHVICMSRLGHGLFLGLDRKSMIRSRPTRRQINKLLMSTWSRAEVASLDPPMHEPTRCAAPAQTRARAHACPAQELYPPLLPAYCHWLRCWVLVVVVMIAWYPTYIVRIILYWSVILYVGVFVSRALFFLATCGFMVLGSFSPLSLVTVHGVGWVWVSRIPQTCLIC